MYIKLMPDYEIPENYFDELLESGVVVDNGTIDGDNHADNDPNA